MVVKTAIGLFSIPTIVLAVKLRCFRMDGPCTVAPEGQGHTMPWLEDGESAQDFRDRRAAVDDFQRSIARSHQLFGGFDAQLAVDSAGEVFW